MGWGDLTEIDAAYLAAALDCDGCLSAEKNYRNKKYAYSTPIFTFGCNSELPLILAKNYGDKTTAFKKKKSSKRPKSQTYVWCIKRQSELRRFLLKIKPHVLLKRKQVDTALEMLQILKEQKQGWMEQLKSLRSRLGLENAECLNPDIDLDDYFADNVNRKEI